MMGADLLCIVLGRSCCCCCCSEHDWYAYDGLLRASSLYRDDCKMRTTVPAQLVRLLFLLLLFHPPATWSQTVRFLGQGPYIAYVSRGARPGEVFYQFFTEVSGTIGNAVTYKLIRPDPVRDTQFAVSSTGGISITNWLPLTNTNYTLGVQASSLGAHGGGAVDANITISTVPQFVNNPRFEHNSFTASLEENSPGNTPITVVRAFSLDPYATDMTHSYSIFGGNDNGAFSINPQTGVLSTTRPLDREKLAMYTLTIRYTDTAGYTETQVQVSVHDVNDNRPTLSKALYTFTVSETLQQNSKVGSLSASDPDSGANGKYSYTLSGTSSSDFAISSSGELTTQHSLDYEQQSVYQAIVITTDMGTPSMSSSAVVIVNVLNVDDECPLFTGSMYAEEVPYPISPSLSVILTVNAIDPDGVQLVKYVILSGNDAGIFSLDATSGDISLANTGASVRGQHTLIVSASDASCFNESTVSVVIGIGTTNNHRPVLDKSTCAGMLIENPPPNHLITTLQATDNDFGPGGEVEFAIVHSIGLFDRFTLDPMSGELRTVNSSMEYDREKTPSFKIGVTATDGGFRQDFCIVEIVLIDENDNTPLFEVDLYTASVSRTAVVGHEVLQVLAYDPDQDLNGKVMYSITSPPSGCPFAINDTTGSITVTGSITATDVCQLTLTATDQGSVQRSSTAFLNITTFENLDNVPLFSQSHFNITIHENYPPLPTSVASVSAIGNPTYKISHGTLYRFNGESTFDIAATSGEIFINSAAGIGVDYEKLFPGPYFFRLLINATSDGYFSVASVTVNVLDQNDNIPHFPVDSITFTVREKDTSPSFISVVQAMDSDQGTNAVVTYSEMGNIFDVNPTNGTIFSTVPFDASVMPSHMVDIDASNPGSTSADRILVTVEVKDDNDQPPAFNGAPFTFNVNENHPIRTKIGQLPASDSDISNQNLIFTIMSGNTDGTFQSRSIGQTGVLFLNKRLDYDRIMSYTLVVQVTDGQHSSTATVTINVLDEDDEIPHFAQNSYYTSIVENPTIGSTILEISAMDVDSSLIHYQLSGPALGRLMIDNNGTIRVSGVIDREDFLPDGQLVFVAFAIGGLISSTNVSISIMDVNDQTPRFVQSPFNGAVPENTDPGVDGLFAVHVRAVDNDAGSNGTITYTLLSGEEDGFRIDSSTGVVTGHQKFDREVRKFYRFTVQAVDDGTPTGLSSTADVIVEISDYNDNSPSWQFPYMYARVFSNAPTGTIVYRLQATDPDSGNNASLTYSIDSNLGPFGLNSSTGEVFVISALNSQQVKQYSFNVSVNDSGTPPLNNTVMGRLVIDVLDAPVFSKTYHHVQSLLESTLLGTSFYNLRADGVNAGSVTYSIISGNTHQSFNVSVQDGTAMVTVARPLDYETITSYILIIEAQEKLYPSLTSTATLNITITDVNDNPPVFTKNEYRTSVSENSPPIANFFQVVANDPDSDHLPGGRVAMYMLKSDSTVFQINPSNGSISILASLDRETQSQHTLTVTAIDNDMDNGFTGTATVIIDVEDKNDNPSKNGGHLDVTISARDGIFPAVVLGNVYFSDPDDQDEFQNCTILDAPEQVMFDVDFNNCSLSLTQGNPAEGVYDMTVQGNDGIHSPVNSTVTVRVSHFTPTPVMIESLITFTLNTSGTFYLDNIGPVALLTDLSFALKQQVVISTISAQQGIFNPAKTVDITISVQDSSSQYENPILLTQQLFAARNQFQFGSAHLFSLATDPCITEPCMNRGLCRVITEIGQSTNRLASKRTILFSPRVDLTYRCVCRVGSAGDLCQTNYDDCFSSPCENGGTCVDGLQNYTCQCPLSATGRNCDIDSNECDSNPCQNGASCRNGVVAPICDCSPGYYGELCQYSYFRTSKLCDSDPCENGGTCSPGRDTFNCQCPVGFSGETCGDTAEFQGGCLSAPCYNGSECIDTLNGTSCVCSIGFTGPLCRFPLNHCELKPCQNGATCETGLYSSYICVCPPGFTGKNCSESIPVCTPESCYNGGTCNEALNSMFTCTCPWEFTGDLCQTSLFPPDLCSASVCNMSNGNCTTSQDGYTCTCHSGYSGNDCSGNTSLLSPCDSNPCQHGGTCTNTSITGYSCLCPLGFTGSNCETNIDDCSTSTPCRNGGTCMDGIDGFLCSCVQGYGGRQCEIHCPLGQTGNRCQNIISYCSNTSCQNGGNCVEEAGGFSCRCPQQFKGPLCNVSNGCENNVCLNEGTCMDSAIHGHVCRCPNMGGPYCELLAISFQGNVSMPSYRAYESLNTNDQLNLKFEFTTLDSNGQLLLNTQYQQGQNRDIISVAIVNSKLNVMLSLGSDEAATITVLSSSVNISDGLWHTVELTLLEKQISVNLDYCTTLDELQLEIADCTSSAAAIGNFSYLDLGLPLWLGGVPADTSEFLPVQSQGIGACVRNVHINSVLLDLASHVAAERSLPGCSEAETCSSADCGRGTCLDRYKHHVCTCPPQLTGETCNEATASVTFGGDGYAQYSLLTNRRSRRQTVATPSTTTISSFQESIFLRFRTEANSGLLLSLQGSGGSNEHLTLSLSDHLVSLSINLGGSTGNVNSSNAMLNDAHWHTVSVSRVGLTASLTVDNENVSLLLPGPHLTLEYNSSGVFVGGRPGPGATVTDGYHGCLEDIRLNQNSLPLSESSDFASFTFVGVAAMAGCSVGPCFPNPCLPGNCTEKDNGTSHMCRCADGRTSTSNCAEMGLLPVGVVALIIAISVLGLVVLLAMLVGLLVLVWRARKSKKYSLAEPTAKGAQHYEVHSNIHSYHEEGGGEADTNFDEGPAAEVSIHELSSGAGSPISSETNIEKNQLDDPYPRANTPDIDCFIEEHVNLANKDITDIDSIQMYSEEGELSRGGSLSSICASIDNEPYTYDRLRWAGREFHRLANLLEPVLTEPNTNSSSKSHR